MLLTRNPCPLSGNEEQRAFQVAASSQQPASSSQPAAASKRTLYLAVLTRDPTPAPPTFWASHRPLRPAAVHQTKAWTGADKSPVGRPRACRLPARYLAARGSQRRVPSSTCGAVLALGGTAFQRTPGGRGRATHPLRPVPFCRWSPSAPLFGSWSSSGPLASVQPAIAALLFLGACFLSLVLPSSGAASLFASPGTSSSLCASLGRLSFSRPALTVVLPVLPSAPCPLPSATPVHLGPPGPPIALPPRCRARVQFPNVIPNDDDGGGDDEDEPYAQPLHDHSIVNRVTARERDHAPGHASLHVDAAAGVPPRKEQISSFWGHEHKQALCLENLTILCSRNIASPLPALRTWAALWTGGLSQQHPSTPPPEHPQPSIDSSTTYKAFEADLCSIRRRLPSTTATTNPTRRRRLELVGDTQGERVGIQRDAWGGRRVREAVAEPKPLSLCCRRRHDAQHLREWHAPRELGQTHGRAPGAGIRH